MSDQFEKTLLSNLIHNEDFTRRTIPFIKEDFFRNRDEVTLFNIINTFVTTYNNLPTKEAIAIELSNNKTLTEDEFQTHVDVTNYNSARRFLVFFMYLNNNDGGNTTFPDYDIEIKPEAGKVLVFPPLWTFKHTGEKPINQPKYIIGSYLHYVWSIWKNIII